MQSALAVLSAWVIRVKDLHFNADIHRTGEITRAHLVEEEERIDVVERRGRKRPAHREARAFEGPHPIDDSRDGAAHATIFPRSATSRPSWMTARRGGWVRYASCTDGAATTTRSARRPTSSP